LNPLVKVLLAVLTGLVFYLALFGFVAEKPLSVGVFDRVYSKKRDYAHSIAEPKIIVAAGSGGLYSARCETIASQTGRPCVNVSIALALGRETILGQVKQIAKPGDIIVLPWEFRLYLLNVEDMRARIAYPYLVRYEKSLLAELGPERALDALFYFDIRYLFSVLLESNSFAAGKRHGLDRDGRLTLQGDYQGHTAEAGQKFREQISALRSTAVETRRVAELTASPAGLADFIEWANDNDMTVFGTLSPSIDTEPVVPAALANMTAWFSTSSDGGFLTIDNNAQYPNDCFFDTREHLNEECQIRHSRKLAAALKDRMSWND